MFSYYNPFFTSPWAELVSCSWLLCFESVIQVYLSQFPLFVLFGCPIFLLCWLVLDMVGYRDSASCFIPFRNVGVFCSGMVVNLAGSAFIHCLACGSQHLECLLSLAVSSVFALFFLSSGVGYRFGQLYAKRLQLWLSILVLAASGTWSSDVRNKAIKIREFDRCPSPSQFFALPAPCLCGSPELWLSGEAYVLHIQVWTMHRISMPEF